jgi:phospholipid/cholesterol/gamma-HCH transport system ATP-binding protein
MALDQQLEQEFIHVTEQAAIAAAKTMGYGDRRHSDQVAVESMRKEMDNLLKTVAKMEAPGKDPDGKELPAWRVGRDFDVVLVSINPRETPELAMNKKVSLLKVMKGDTMIIMGGSGCGKSTLLRHIIGAMKPTSGSVKLFGEEITGLGEKELAPIRRRFGMLFQSGALLQSLTVGENVALPIVEHGKLDPSIVDLMVKMKLEMVGLTGFEHLKPAEISGGMKKRAALARAIANNPEYLFCDEPNSGLDPKTSIVIDDLIQDITQEYNITTVVVTHDMNSVLEIGENIMFVYKGESWWTGNKDQVLTSTNTEFKDFVFASKFMRTVVDKQK